MSLSQGVTKPDLCLEKMALAAMERMDCRGQVQEAVTGDGWR